jgi:hypothetical protein
MWAGGSADEITPHAATLLDILEHPNPQAGDEALIRVSS